MPPLELFGYKSLKTPSSLPLIVVLAQADFSEPPAHDEPYFDDLFFGTGISVARYFSQISNGRFTFVRAGNGIYKLRLTKYEIALPLDERFPIIRDKLVQAGFNFEAWPVVNANGDNTVDQSELAMIVIDSASEDLGVTQGSSHAIFDGHQIGWSGKAAAAGHRSSLMTFCHELIHVLGVDAELYGSTNLNYRYSTMCATEGMSYDNRQSWHLDPFFKMKFGWCEPRTHEANSSGSFELTMHGVGSTDAAVILYDSAYPMLSKTSYMLEYRSKKVPFDEDVGSTGVAAWRVQLDSHLNPYTIPGSNGNTDWTVYIEGPPDWARGRGPLWTAGDTPFFNWDPHCYLTIPPFKED